MELPQDASIDSYPQEVARYLDQIVPPVLACFTDQDARVRYYACESMYNISKVAKGEILPFFNEVFDALCKLAADSELSVKNGAELLDRLIKDIVSESAATYVSVNDSHEEAIVEDDDSQQSLQQFPRAFSLGRFIPLLNERIYVINPFTRVFLVAWITLLDSIPDLELVSYLPEFLGGLFNFLSDPNRDVYAQTQHTLERFLNEIKRIARIKKEVTENTKEQDDEKTQAKDGVVTLGDGEGDVTVRTEERDDDGDSNAIVDFPDYEANGGYIPGQDVRVDHAKILEILVEYLSTSSEREIQLMALHWIENFFDDSPDEILLFVPKLIAHVLPALSNPVEKVRQEAEQLNTSLMEFVASLPGPKSMPQSSITVQQRTAIRSSGSGERQNSSSARSTPEPSATDPRPASSRTTRTATQAVEPQPSASSPAVATQTQLELDYSAAVDALTNQFRNEHETTRLAAVTWLLMLHRKAPSRLLSLSSDTFPALLKTLSDPSESVVTRDLQLLSQISRTTDDRYFHSLMVNLLQLFASDRKLLETRGNLIVRQLCVNLSAERIYSTLAECLDREMDAGSSGTLGLDADPEFASIMVQNLNNNLITAPELAPLRRRLRNLPTTSQSSGGVAAGSTPSTPSLSSSSTGTLLTSSTSQQQQQQPSLSLPSDPSSTQSLFTTLFRTFAHNPLSVFTLCLLSQSYEAAYSLLTIIGSELETTLPMLIQIDKLVQLLESPVFTYLRLQLLEPERWPFLYKCLYGLLMLLPQSSAFAALKNRLGSVSAIGYLHVPGRLAGSANSAVTPKESFEQRGPGRLSGRKDADAAAAAAAAAGSAAGAGQGIRWPELFERFRTVQERARRSRGGIGGSFAPDEQPLSGFGGSGLGLGMLGMQDSQQSQSQNQGQSRVMGHGQGQRAAMMSAGTGRADAVGGRPGLGKAETSRTEASVGSSSGTGVERERSHRRSGLAHLRRLAPGRNKTTSSGD